MNNKQTIRQLNNLTYYSYIFLILFIFFIFSHALENFCPIFIPSSPSLSIYYLNKQKDKQKIKSKFEQ